MPPSTRESPFEKLPCPFEKLPWVLEASRYHGRHIYKTKRHGSERHGAPTTDVLRGKGLEMEYDYNRTRTMTDASEPTDKEVKNAPHELGNS